MTLAEDSERRDAAKARATERRDGFAAAVPADLNAQDDRIAAELSSANASARSKLGKVYRLIDAVSKVAAPYIACRRGCAACCKMNVSITSIEAERLAVATGRKMVPQVQPSRHALDKFSGAPCPFLVDDECSVYEVRPLACRVHYSFDVDNYWCQPERSNAVDMPMVSMRGAQMAYAAIAGRTRLGGCADIRDFFPPE